MLNTILCLLRIVHGFGYYNEDRWTVFKYHIFCVGNAEHTRRYYLKGRSQKENTGLLGDFSQHGGRGLPNSQNFCKLTKYFFACQIHSEVLKHVLQRGGGDI